MDIIEKAKAAYHKKKEKDDAARIAELRSQFVKLSSRIEGIKWDGSTEKVQIAGYLFDMTYAHPTEWEQRKLVLNPHNRRCGYINDMVDLGAYFIHCEKYNLKPQLFEKEEVKRERKPTCRKCKKHDLRMVFIGVDDYEYRCYDCGNEQETEI